MRIIIVLLYQNGNIICISLLCCYIVHLSVVSHITMVIYFFHEKMKKLDNKLYMTDIRIAEHINFVIYCKKVSPNFKA